MTLISKEYREGNFEVLIQPLLRENMKQLFIDNFGGWSDVVSKDKFFEVIQEGIVQLFFKEKEFVGYISASPEKDNSQSLLIHDIQIKKEYQRKGFGKQILLFIENKAKEISCTQLKAFVFKNNPAREFYLHQGFIDSKKGKSHTLIVVKSL